jgi:hypothetical protein
MFIEIVLNKELTMTFVSRQNLALPVNFARGFACWVYGMC